MGQGFGRRTHFPGRRQEKAKLEASNGNRHRHLQGGRQAGTSPSWESCLWEKHPISLSSGVSTYWEAVVVLYRPPHACLPACPLCCWYGWSPLQTDRRTDLTPRREGEDVNLPAHLPACWSGSGWRFRVPYILVCFLEITEPPSTPATPTLLAIAPCWNPCLGKTDGANSSCALHSVPHCPWRRQCALCPACSSDMLLHFYPMGGKECHPGALPTGRTLNIAEQVFPTGSYRRDSEQPE